MTVIQILILFFVLFALGRAIIQFRRGRLPIGLLAFWLAFWFIAGAVAILPQTTDIAARFVGVGRGADFVLYISVMALFYLCFRLFVKIEDVERQITRLVRKIALEDIDIKEE
jgi:small membrane protein